jgi:hypothetical protein
MDNTKILGRARFKDGKLISPSKEKNTRPRNNDKQDTLITSFKRVNSLHQDNNSESQTQEEEQALDLNKWKQENQGDWIKIRQKVEKNRKIK